MSQSLDALRDYEIFETAGQGTFGSVFIGRDRLTGCPCAIKRFAKTPSTDDDSSIKSMWREVEMMKGLDHPFISDLYDFVETDSEYLIVSEAVDDGSLLELVNSHGKLSEDDARLVMAEVCSALLYLHEEKLIVHRDLKPENVLLDRNSNVRLIDFGLCNVADTKRSTICGSPAYIAPEMISSQPYRFKADIWSLGVMLYAITTSKLPFEHANISVQMQMILNEEPTYPMDLSPELTDLLQNMLKKDPKERISCRGILGHPWITRGGREFVDLKRINVHRSNYERPDFALNPKVLEMMESFGVDPTHLESDLKQHRLTRAYAVYHSLLRELETDMLEGIQDEIFTSDSAANPFLAAPPRPAARPRTLSQDILSCGGPEWNRKALRPPTVQFGTPATKVVPLKPRVVSSNKCKYRVRSLSQPVDAIPQVIVA